MKLSILSFFITLLFLVGCIDKNVSAQTNLMKNNPYKSAPAKSGITNGSTRQLSTEEVKFAHFIEEIKVKASKNGISQQVINDAFTGVALIKQVINADKNQLEKKVTLDDYLGRVLPSSRIIKANENHKQYRTLLTKIAKKYAVPSNYIVALWAMESNFGQRQGNENIISAMATLAFEGRREAFFSKQLMAALTILEQGHVSMDKLKGSWAGAMGQCQFMPTSFLRYAADGDGDGVIDIWDNLADVFASTANYLSTEGWDPTQRWGREVTLTKKFKQALIGLDDNKSKTVSQWIKLGVKVKIDNKTEMKQQAWLIAPDDQQGRIFIVYDNFRTIMHWNRSSYFAISIGMLADSISL